MTNKETLELLKPIMLDGSERVGDKLYCVRVGEVEIKSFDNGVEYPIKCKSQFHGTFSYTTKGIYDKELNIVCLFKCNPFEWLNEQLFIEQRQNEMLVAELKERDNNQERVIEVKEGSIWKKRVLICIKNGFAICWGIAENIEQSKNIVSVAFYDKWREVTTQTTITKEQALQMLAEKGVDTTNLIIE